MSEAQAGFRTGYSTTDQIFTLKCIVELFLCQGRRQFCTFVDYSKAFDLINRATLWKKLISYGTSGKLLNCNIEYVRILLTCRIETRREFVTNDMEKFFTKQKLNTLNYIDKLYNNTNGGVNGMLYLFVLLYADDTLIMAENERDMQWNLNLLNKYCECNGSRVSISKTKIMAFARSKTRLRKLSLATWILI